jgi:RNA polymerase sigma factor (sigma-70 family)
MRKGFLDLYEHDSPRLVRFMIRYGVSLPQAQDAAQDAFEAAWKLLSEEPAKWEEVDNPAAWLRAVAIRMCKRPPNRKRPRKGQAEAGETLVGDVPETLLLTAGDPGEISVQTMAVLDALRSLPEEQRMLMSFHMDGFSLAEIARERGMKEQKVRDLVRRARQTLKDQLVRAATEDREWRNSR